MSGKVYEYRFNDNTGSISYPEYNDSHSIDSRIGGIGAITNGNLGFEIIEPDTLLSAGDLFTLIVGITHEQAPEIIISNPNVIGNLIASFEVGNQELVKSKETANYGSTSAKLSFEQTAYVYVTDNVSISRGSFQYTQIVYSGGIPVNTTFDMLATTLNLKKGWNAIYIKNNITLTYLNTISAKNTISITHNNPNLRWVLLDVAVISQTGFPDYEKVVKKIYALNNKK